MINQSGINVCFSLADIIMILFFPQAQGGLQPCVSLLLIFVPCKKQNNEGLPHNLQRDQSST